MPRGKKLRQIGTSHDAKATVKLRPLPTGEGSGSCRRMRLTATGEGANIPLSNNLWYNLRMNKNVKLARILRNNQTEQEEKLWQLIRNNKFYGYKFRRQFPIGDYIVDFVCLEKRIIIELDGGQHNEPEHIRYDNERTAYLERRCYKVIRFWNNEVNENIVGVYEKLQQEFGIEY